MPLINGIGIPPRTLEGGVGVGRQLKVTARCHSTVQSHYTSCRLRSYSPSSHDGQMTIIPALLFHSVSSSSAYMCFCDFVPIYILKSVKLYCWQKCQAIILLHIKTFKNLMVINDCILFLTIANFHFLALQLHSAADL